ncbi:MAG: type II and III secretion system protein family protein, partial [Acetobacteraceae bacterium]
MGTIVPMPAQGLALEAGSGRVIALPGAVASVFAADPKVAEVRPASPTSLFIFGVAPGRTTIAALDAAGHPVAQYTITVRPSAFGASEALGAIDRVMPGSNVRVDTTTGGLVLRGQVATAADADEAMSMARRFTSPGQHVDNDLTVLGSTQVTLRVRIAEMSRTVVRALGVNWQALGTVGRFAVNLATNNAFSAAATGASVLGLGYRGAVNVNALIDALAQDDLVHVLAEPNLTAMSGQTASFLVGGEFPIPVGQENGQITVEFKKFGVSLAFVPTVLSSGRISLRVEPEVSQLSTQGAVQVTAGSSSLSIPALTVRRAETTVELGSGQSFAIAGLLQDSTDNNVSGLPGLGEIPILGALFRSNSFQHNQTELVIVITPYITRPVDDPTAIKLPTDGYSPPDDLQRLLL